MGNSAVITTREKRIGVYLRWHGGRDSVAAFLKYCALREFRPPEEDCYGWARLCQVIANYFGGGASVGIDAFDEVGCGDHGVFVIARWRIVEREHVTESEQEHYDLLDMLREINEKQPEGDRLSDEAMETAAALERIERGAGIVIRPCVEDRQGNVGNADVSDARAKFFGVYRRGKDGLLEHIEDFSSRQHAVTFVNASQEK